MATDPFNEGLSFPITADTSGLKTGLAETDAELAKTDSSFQGFTTTLEENKLEIIAVGAAMTATGLAIIGLTDVARDTNAELAGTAITLGSTTEEMRNLALATSDAGFPLDDVVATFDLLARSGLTTDQLAATSAAFDDLGDATGNSAAQVTQSLIPAFNAFDIPLTEASAHIDGLTYLTKNSTIELSDFASTMSSIAPKLDAMGVSMEDAEAIMLALNDQGIQGTTATRAFRTAISEADGDINTFYSSLGVTKSAVEEHKTAIEGAAGATKAYADAAETSIGSTDKMKSAFEEWTLSAGTLLEPLDGLGAALAVSGPLMIGITGLPALIGLVNTSLLFLAANPIVLVVAAIVGLVAVLVLLETEFGVVSACADALGVAWQWLSDNVIAPFIGWLTEATAGIDVIGIAFTVLLGPIGVVSVAMQALGIDWEDVWDAITWVTESASDTITWVVEALTDSISWAFDNLVYPLQDAWDNLWGGMEYTIEATSDFIMGIVDGITGSITGMINIAIDSINSMIEGVNMLSFDIPDLFGGPPTHIGFNIAPIPRLASGGIVTSPTLAMIGEAGPEAVIPLSRGGAGAGMGGVTITGNTFNVRNDGDIKAIAQELQTLITRTNRGRGIS